MQSEQMTSWQRLQILKGFYFVAGARQRVHAEVDEILAVRSDKLVGNSKVSGKLCIRFRWKSKPPADKLKEVIVVTDYCDSIKGV